MKRTTKSAAAVFALLIGLTGAQAQNLRNADQPAEYPPASYTGKQYVDSKGCVFVRAGFDGAVTWVPRVSRKRTVLCGFSPTFANKPAPAAPPVAVAAAPATPPKVTAPPRAATPAATPPRATAPAPTRRVVTAPAPTRRTVVAPPPRVAVAPPPTRRTGCGASAISQHYLNTNSGYAVRCGPQTENPTSATGISYDGVPPGAIRVAPPPRISPPPGYRAAFDDGRLNPDRGIQTAEGYAQSSLFWTQDVPRRLIDRNTGRDVTDLFRWLKYPFTSRRSMEEQVNYRPDPRSVWGFPKEKPTAPVTRFSTKGVEPAAAAPRPTASTPRPVRTTATPPSRATKPAYNAPAGHRFVQVGLFGVPSNAQTSAARLQAMGLPVRIGKYQKAGKTYHVVMAGPFSNAGQLNAGLNAARRAGFRDAYTRR